MSARCAHFKLTDFIRPGESYHFARTELTSANGAVYHDHDYHELFWATRGAGEQRWNGRKSALQINTLYLVRPQDRHCVVGSSQNPMRIMNLAFPSEAWRAMRARYFSDDPDWFEQPESERAWSLEPRAQGMLNYWSDRLLAEGRPRVVLDGFLMEFPQLRTLAGAEMKGQVPDWLAHARREIARPEYFIGGAPAFARLAGRSPSHVARAAVRWLGATPTDIVNAARMDYTAEKLAETERPIIDIMFDCGLTNLSHYYALFRKRFGMSPRRYRLQAHRTVRG